METSQFYGFESINNLKEIVARYNAKDIFLVTGRDSFKKCGAYDAIYDIVGSLNVFHYNDFSPNPKIEDVERAVELYRYKQFDLVIAVGGGSVIDTAKLINFFANSNCTIESYLENADHLVLNKTTPLVAIPTTSGSGSEATHFAVLYVNSKKYSIAHKSITPSNVIIDPAFTMGLPKYITACTAMDAFCQALEAFWSVNSTEESLSYSIKAIRLCLDNISDVVNRPDRTNRENMAMAAYLAGKAINIAKTTASHAISYPISSNFGIPHGHAVALTISELLVFNANHEDNDLVEKRGLEYYRNKMGQLLEFFDCQSFFDCGQKLKELIQGIGLETSLSALNIEDIGTIQSQVDPVRMGNNPMKLTSDSIGCILEKIK